MIPGLLSSFLNHLRRRSWLFLQGPCSLSAGPPQSGTLESQNMQQLSPQLHMSGLQYLRGKQLQEAERFCFHVHQRQLHNWAESMLNQEIGMMRSPDRLSQSY